jgi:uncharacterized protein (TIGR02246 family)
MSAQDESAVRALIQEFVDAWNRHDMRTLAGLFAEDADFVDVFGNWFKDRTTIEDALAQRHATVFRKSRFAEKEVVVRFHKPDLAIVHAVIELSGAVDRRGQALPPGLGVITSVIEKTNSGWQIIALQNTAVAAPQPPAP